MFKIINHFLSLTKLYWSFFKQTKFFLFIIILLPMDMNNDGIGIDKFSLLTVIGKGSYAKVLLVRKKDNDKLYAMKALKKKYIEQKRQEVNKN